MNININNTIKNTEIENIIWVIYLFIIGANFISNYYTTKYCYTFDLKYRKIYRTINIIILTIVLLIYIYFVYISYKQVKNDKQNELYKKCIFIASILILIGGIIYLIVEVYKNNNPEISII